MIDVDSLTTGIIAQLLTEQTLIAPNLTNKIGLGILPESVSRPYCSFNIINDQSNPAYGHRFLESLVIQFGVYANSLSLASSLAKMVGQTLHAASLTLSNGTFVGAIRRPGTRVVNLSVDPRNMVYVVYVVIEFYVNSNL